jgi:hypothetical protein
LKLIFIVIMHSNNKNTSNELKLHLRYKISMPAQVLFSLANVDYTVTQTQYYRLKIRYSVGNSKTAYFCLQFLPHRRFGNTEGR